VLLVVFAVSQQAGIRVLVLHVVHARTDIDDRLERRVRGHILDPLAVDPDLAVVTQTCTVLFAGSDHRRLRLIRLSLPQRT
jgi:hypothetical protein